VPRQGFEPRTLCLEGRWCCEYLGGDSFRIECQKLRSNARPQEHLLLLNDVCQMRFPSARYEFAAPVASGGITSATR